MTEITLMYRTVLLYLFVLLAIRIMGKREVGQLSAFDLVVAIMIAELAAMSMERIEMPLYQGLIPIFTLVGLEVFMSWVGLKNFKFRRFVDGTPSIVIADGKIMEKEMRKLRYNISDLLVQLREKDVLDVGDVQYAVLETSGELSVILKPGKKPLTLEDMGIIPSNSGLPVPLIIDGKVHKENLQKLDFGKGWLEFELQKQGVSNKEDVVFAALDSKGKLYVTQREDST